MVSAISRIALRTAALPRRPVAPLAVTRRNMSGDAEHAAEEMVKWKKLTAGMSVLTLIVTGYVIATEEHHHKDEDAPVPSYMQIRNKPFPWTCAGCSLLDSKCFQKCKEEREMK